MERPTSVEEMRERFSRFVTAEGMRRALAFRPRPDDVFIATYPKSGTTWLQQIVHGLRTGGEMEFDEITAVVPWLELAYDMGIDPEAEPPAPPRAFKSHMSWHEVPKGGRYICAIRDPGDVLVSLYRFLEGWFFERGSISMDAFALQHFIRGTRSGGYWEHLLSWWERRGESEVLLLCFEDMRRDLRGTVERVASFIGLAPEPALCDLVTRQSTIEFMKAHEGRFDDHLVRESRDAACGLPPGGSSSKVRRGDVGGHATQIGPAVRAALDAAWRERVQARLGFPDYGSLRAALARA